MVGYIILAVIAAALVITAIKAIFFVPKKKEVPVIEKEKVDTGRVQQNLSKAIQFKTVSRENLDEVDWEEFKKYHKFIDEAYPLISKNTEKEEVSRASLIYNGRVKTPTLSLWLCSLIRM